MTLNTIIYSSQTVRCLLFFEKTNKQRNNFLNIKPPHSDAGDIRFYIILMFFLICIYLHSTSDILHSPSLYAALAAGYSPPGSSRRHPGSCGRTPWRPRCCCGRSHREVASGGIRPASAASSGVHAPKLHKDNGQLMYAAPLRRFTTRGQHLMKKFPHAFLTKESAFTIKFQGKRIY